MVSGVWGTKLEMLPSEVLIQQHVLLKVKLGHIGPELSGNPTKLPSFVQAIHMVNKQLYLVINNITLSDACMDHPRELQPAWN